MHKFHQNNLLIAFLLIVPFALQAHKGSIRGIVCNVATGKPLEGVSIYLEDGKRNEVTDVFGRFFVKDIEPGSLTIVLSHIGFQSKQEIVKVEDGVTTDLNYSLLPVQVTMSSVSVSSKRDLSSGSISGIDLKLRPVNSTQDMLRLVPGLFIAQHQGGGKAEQIFLRGFDCDHGTDINVSVDNMPVNMVSHAHGQGFADAHFIIPEAVQEVDYGKGPYQIDKGNLCTAGFIAFKTRNELEQSFVKADAGSFGYFRTAAGLNLLDRVKSTDSNSEAYVLGEYVSSKGYFDAPQNFNRFNLMGKYTNYISSNKILTVTTSAFHSNWDASGQIPMRAIQEGIAGRYGCIDPESGATGRYNLNVQYFQSVNAHSYFKSNIYLTKYDFSLFSDFTYFAIDSFNGDQVHQAENRVTEGYNGEYGSTYSIHGLKTKTQVGAGFRNDDINNDELSHTIDRAFVLNRIQLGDVHETNVFGYFNQTVYLLPQLVLNFGTRFDEMVQRYDDRLVEKNRVSVASAGRFSPKAGISYTIGEKARIYYSYGTGFHSNDTRTLALGNQQGRALQIGNTLPLAFSHDLGLVIKPTPKLMLSGAVWLLNMQQEFAYAGDVAVIDTSGKTRRFGLDVSARYTLSRWLYLFADFNLAHCRESDPAEGQNFLPLAPGFTSVGGFTYKPNSKLSLSFSYRHMSERPANNDYSLVATGYTVCDAVANYSYRNFDFGVQVQNLFNTQWNEAQFATETRLKMPNGKLEQGNTTDVCFTPGTPLFVKLSAAWKF